MKTTADILLFANSFNENGYYLLISVFLIILIVSMIYFYCNAYAKKLKTKRIAFYERGCEEENFRIVHISDLHINCLPLKTQDIIGEIAAENPDLVIFTGDFSHSSKEKYKKASLDFIENIVNCVGCPVYITYGNHDRADMLENDSLKEKSFTAALKSISPRVYVLENDMATFYKNGSLLCIGGLSDISVNKADIKSVCEAWRAYAEKENAVLAVISHNPDILLQAEDNFADFFLAGHTHAGQFRLPFHAEFKLLRRRDKLACRGIFYGKHELKGVPVYISSGLGCSLLPVRFGTYPETVLIEVGFKK